MASQLDIIQDLIAKGYSPEQAASLMNANAQSGNNAVDDAINATAARAGMDPKYWRGFASMESSLNPTSNYNRRTQYKGLFQIGSDEWARHGGGRNIYDPMANASAAAELAAANNATFRAHFGRDPTPAETYLMHQQGPGFYTKGTMTNIAGNLPPEARTPENMTREGFERWWTNRLERAAGNPQPAQYTPVTPGGGMRTGTPSVAIGPASTTPVTADSVAGKGPDLGSALGAVSKMIGKQNEDSGFQLQPMQLGMMQTPAMQRARQMAQAMLARQMGTEP